MKRILSIALLTLGLAFAGNTYAQCDTIATICNKHMSSDFISDGQQYRALLRPDETAEFQLTLYGGSTYRIGGCSGMTDGNLVFTLLDQERNVLFTNNEFGMAPYWDFKVASTMDCIIEATLNPQGNAISGCAVMLISFQE